MGGTWPAFFVRITHGFPTKGLRALEPAWVRFRRRARTKNSLREVVLQIEYVRLVPRAVAAAPTTQAMLGSMRIPGLVIETDLAALDWRLTRVEGVCWFPLHLEDEERERENVSHDAAGAVARERGASAVLIRMDPGVGYERHRHVGPESVLVLQGGYRDDTGEVRQGEFAHYAAGSVHAPVALGDPSRPRGPDNPACVLYAVAVDGIELLDR